MRSSAQAHMRLTCGGMCAQVRLITLLTSCGTKDGGGMGEMFEVHLNSAAVQRFHSLLSTLGAPKGEPQSPKYRTERLQSHPKP